MKKKDTSPARNAATQAAPAREEPKRSMRAPRILVYVDAVARHGSIRKAAEALHIASSALNRRILDLEDELGVALFERLPRGVRLTSAGELFIGHVRRSLADLELVGSQIEHLRGMVRGKVSVAAAESLAGDLLPRAIAQFQAVHPGVRFHVRINAPGDLMQSLANDTVDLVLAHELPEHRDLSVLASVEHPFCAVVSANHPLAAHPGLRLSDCIAYPIALADETLAGRELINRALAKSSFHFEPALVANSVETMKAYARLSQAVCFQFRAGTTRDVELGELVAIPLSDAALAHAHLVLAMRRGRVLPIAAAAFAEQLRQTLASL